jgi:hypothetical protein
MTTMRKIRFNVSHAMEHYHAGETRWVRQGDADYYTLTQIGSGLFIADDITPKEEPVTFPVPLPTPERPLGTFLKEKGWLQSFFDACHAMAMPAREVATPLAVVTFGLFCLWQAMTHQPQIWGFVHETAVLASGLSDMGEDRLAMLSPVIVAEGK